MSLNKAKVVVIGPCQSGKSVISNFLADATETSGGEYHPTQGCRILEFEVNNVEVGSRSVTTEVELWDVSGDHKFEACWPAIARDTNGVVFVFNSDNSSQAKELESWYEYFVSQMTTLGIRDDQCIIFAHQKPDSYSDGVEPPPPMANIKCINTNVDSNGEALRDTFTDYLGQLLTALSDKREQEELSIMNTR